MLQNLIKRIYRQSNMLLLSTISVSELMKPLENSSLQNRGVDLLND